MGSRSITRQTLTIVVVAQLVFALLLGTAAVLSERHTRMRALEQQIAGRSDSLLGAIQDAEDPEDNITIDPAELRLPPEDRYAVYSDTGRLIGRSPQPGPTLPKDGEMGQSNLRLDGVNYSVLRRTALRIIDRAEYGGVGLRRPVVIVYASSESRVLHEVFEAVGRLIATILLTSIVVAFTTALLLRRALRPIRELALAAQCVTPTSLQFQAPQGAMQVDELRPLATTLSELIDELREAFAKEQRFVGDAAHELKTAVAVVRSSIQVLLLRRRSETEYIAGLEQVLEDNDRVESLVTSMLELASLERLEEPGVAPLDLSLAAQKACELMQSLAAVRSVRLTLDATPGANIGLSPDRANTLIANLLTNAIRHSRPESSIRVNVRRTDATVALVVEDSGDGIRPEALPHVLERFYRDDPSRSRTSGGNGLGLAICKSIVDSAGATIAIESELCQGTRVTVTFSAA
jgi:signal transduction histidine kinase